MPYQNALYIYIYIYFTIYLFIYIFKKEFYEAETFSVVFGGCVGKRSATREAGANHRFMSPVIVFRWYIDYVGGGTQYIVSNITTDKFCTTGWPTLKRVGCSASQAIYSNAQPCFRLQRGPNKYFVNVPNPTI